MHLSREAMESVYEEAEHFNYDKHFDCSFNFSFEILKLNW